MKKVVFLLVVGLATASPAKQMLINVNLDTTERQESTLDGPFDGNGGSDLNTTWNQILRGPGRSWTIDDTALMDSTGAATTVKFRVDKNGHTLGCWAWGTPDLVILTSAITGWDPDVDSYDLVFSGLTGGIEYDLYIASFHPNENGGRALFSTTNATTTESPQIVDNGGGGGNDITWAEGENYVLFEKVEPDGNGEIIIHVYSDWTTDNTKRAYVSGFQLVTSPTPLLAGSPNPEDEATDVPRDVVLSWMRGEYAAQHDVYLGTSFDDVNDATTASAAYQGRQAGTTFAPDWLEFGTTYYWRIDEVNAPPDYTVFKGSIWQFTVEPFAYPIENVTATASSSHQQSTGPENTVNGSGLDENDLHSTVTTDMWLSGAAGPQPTWIQYEFDKVYKLYEMWVWNYNMQFENIIGFGLKVVTVQYSTNGVDWKALSDVQFAWGPGAAGYAHDTIVDFGGVVAKYVKITAKSNWGGQAQYGLSEVRFFYVPVWAREPNPASGITDVDLDVVLSWRAGREAATHQMYFSTSQQAVINGTGPVTTVTEASHGPLSLDLGKTYYWRVDEANDLETPSTWKGDVWNFRTHEFIAVEDFESYNDYCSRIFYAWKDGWGHSADPDCGIVASGGNGTGSTVGNLSAPFAEQTIVHSGAQSMPFEYDNSGATGKARYSEAQREWAVPQDWTKGNVKALTLWFHGDTDNTPETLYVALEDNASQLRVATHPNPEVLQAAGWQEWNIALTQFSGVNLASVKKMYLGVGNRNNPQMGGSGKLYFDDIRLYPSRCVLSRRSADFAKVDYVQDCVVDYRELEVMAENWLAVPAATGIVPNGDFELMYKPGTAITGVVSDGGWTQGVGPDCPIDDGQYIFSDETTGTVVDIPGWVGYDKEAWIALGGTYGRDQTTGNLQGSVARQGNYTPGGLHCYLANGGDWGNAAGGLIVSDAPLGNVEDGIYTLSMVAQGGATPVVLEMLAGGIALTPTSSVDPDLTADWQVFSRTYGSASLVGHIGQPLTIVLGVGRDASGTQTRFDDVTLLHNSEPLPILPLAGRRVDLYEDNKIDFKDYAVLADTWLDEQLWP